MAERTYSVNEGSSPASWLRRTWGAVPKHKGVLLGGTILLVVVLTALLADVLTVYDPLRMNPINRLKPPLTSGHFLGTDHFGRDLLTRLIYGARLSLSVGAGVIAVTGAVGILIGVAAGLSDRVERVAMRVMDAFMCFPAILLALALMAILGRSVGNVIIALSIVYTPRMARVVRSNVLAIRGLDYVQAARALGVPITRVVWKHILPNCMGPIIVQGTFLFANAVLSEASLSFLGVGVDPGTPSWGIMLSEGRTYMRNAPWLTLLPGFAIMLTVLGLNVLGDGLRDTMDPAMKNRR